MKPTKAQVATLVMFAVALVITFFSMFGAEAFMLSTLTIGTFCLGSLVLLIPFLARFALSSPDADKTKLPKYRLVPALALLVVAIALGSATIWINYAGSNPFERTIIRHVDNEQESALLSRAESLDFGAIQSVERFNTSSGEPRCRFIDKQAIDFFYDRVGELQSRGPPNRASMRYEADVYPVEKLNFRTSSGFSARFNISFGPGNMSFWGFLEKGDDSRITFSNGTAHNNLVARTVVNGDYSYSGGYLVVMRLTTGFGTSKEDLEKSMARQYVYFDDGGIARFIAFERHEGDIIYM